MPAPVSRANKYGCASFINMVLYMCMSMHVLQMHVLQMQILLHTPTPTPKEAHAHTHVHTHGQIGSSIGTGTGTSMKHASIEHASMKHTLVILYVYIPNTHAHPLWHVCTLCALYVHSVCTLCALYVHSMCTLCALYVFSMCVHTHTGTCALYVTTWHVCTLCITLVSHLYHTCLHSMYHT